MLAGGEISGCVDGQLCGFGFSEMRDGDHPAPFPRWIFQKNIVENILIHGSNKLNQSKRKIKIENIWFLDQNI